MDDPREILREAGAECADVDAWAEQVFTGEFSDLKTVPEALSIIGPLREVVVASNAAVLALARLAAKYKWVAEHHESVVDRVIMERPLQFDALEARWVAEHDIELVPKDDWHTGRIGPDRWFRARAQGCIRADAPAAPLGGSTEDPDA